MRVAIIHDWLNGMRGGERVLEALLELYPSATIYTLFHQPHKISRSIESHPIVTSWLDRLPGIHRYYRNLLPLFPAAVESLNLRGFDLVISSSHAVAKGVRTPDAIHICYCHTPMRYIWDAEQDYRLNAVRRTAFRGVKAKLRRWDCESAGRVDHFLANSRFVAQRIREFYGRDAEVIYPPVDTAFFTPSKSVRRGDFYLVAGALVAYKRFDLVVDAFNAMARPLVIAGTGPELKRIRRRAARNISVLGWVPDEELRSLYRAAKGLVFAGREDFGMVPVEAQSCGCPVIAYGAGGCLETVQDGINGVLFTEQRVDALVRAIERFESMTWSVEHVRYGVEGFSREVFKTQVRKFITSRTEKQNNSRDLVFHST